MLSSLLSNFLFGVPKQTEEAVDNEQILKHTSVQEENGDWLLISCDSSSGKSNSCINSECDLDSQCSDSSWIITPAPTFRRSGSNYLNEPAHSLEDLLIEHPTMSVYRQNSLVDKNEVATDMEVEGTVANTDEEWNRKRELVLDQNRQRQQLAAYLQIPLTRDVLSPSSKSNSGVKHPKVARKAIKRHNGVSRLGIKHQVQKCGFKAGRRRC